MSAVGLFGGTFDPVHFGHLRLATELAEAFHLEKVIFLPAGLPYHRGRAAHASNEQRLTMLKLVTARDARFDVDDRELRRDCNTYTYDTLREIRLERGPHVPLVFLTGSDAFAQIDTWNRWTELFDLAARSFLEHASGKCEALERACVRFEITEHGEGLALVCKNSRAHSATTRCLTGVQSAPALGVRQLCE